MSEQDQLREDMKRCADHHSRSIREWNAMIRGGWWFFAACGFMLYGAIKLNTTALWWAWVITFSFSVFAQVASILARNFFAKEYLKIRNNYAQILEEMKK